VPATVLIATALVAPGWDSHTAQAESTASRTQGKRSSAGRFNCGYDSRGAADQVSTHRLHELELSTRNSVKDLAAQAITGPLAQDAGDTAIVEDDGTILIPQSQFSLKKSSILFTPDGDGYRISSGGVPFDGDFGDRLGNFLGADGRIGDGDNGYRDVTLLGAKFKTILTVALP
jgi:hypothetical protein